MLTASVTLPNRTGAWPVDTPRRRQTLLQQRSQQREFTTQESTAASRNRQPNLVLCIYMHISF